MLEVMRKHAQSWISKVILGGIILSFALWGVGDYFLGSRVQVVAEVDGNPMPDSAFAQAYERQLGSIRAMLGGNVSKEMIERLGLKQETIQTMINRQLMLDEAQRTGLTAPEATLLARVRANPVFQASGSFDQNRYRILTRNMGFRTPSDYEAEQRLNLMVDALQKGILNSASASEEQVRDRFEDEYENRVIAAIIVDPVSLEGKIKVSDAAARDYYEAHKENYRSPLRLKLAIAEIQPGTGDIEIDESEIQAVYEEQRDRLSKPEQRHARHILVRLAVDAGENTRNSAFEKIQKAADRIKAGEDFAKVAREMSDDTSAKDGGDLGMFERGKMVAPFEEAAFSMQDGEVSEVVETQFGLHLIQLLETTPEQVTPLAEVRDDIAQELRLEKTNNEAYQLSQDLDDALGREDSLKAAADSMNLAVRELELISQDEALAESLFATEHDFRRQTFAKAPGDTVEVVELSDGRFVAVEVLERLEPDVLPFAKVTAKVYLEAKRRMAEEQARSLADEILSKAKQAKFDKLAQQYGQPIYISKPVRRLGTGDDATWLTTKVLEAAFATPAGETFATAIDVPQGQALIQVRNITAAKDDEFAKQKAAIKGELLRGNGAVRFARWMASVRDRHDIVVHDDVLDRF